jgi:hypothetical protein
MIRTVADLLDAIRRKEAAVLGKWNLKHGPMIGDMYEGLTRHIIDKAVFDGLDLHVVDGKITNESGELSDQIDCMLVRGAGVPIPYTNSFIYPVGQVIAVIEVKKSLYSRGLEDAYMNLSSVVHLHLLRDEKFRAARRAFRSITHRDVTHQDWPEVPYGDKMLFRCIADDSLAPLRIILGYDGFSTEEGLRNAFLDYLARQLPSGSSPSSFEAETGITGFGPYALPNLIVCNDRALIKLNGMPFSGHVDGELSSAPEARKDNWWVLLGSSDGNPTLFLLEIVWTRLQNLFALPPEIFGEDLEIEPITPLLFARPIAGKGWEYLEHRLSEKTLRETEHSTNWEPVFLDEVQFVIINILCKDEEIDIDGDSDLHRFVANGGLSMDALIDRMKSTGLVHIDARRRMRLITESCTTAVLSDGRFVAGENSTGRLIRWVLKTQAELKARKSKPSQ